MTTKESYVHEPMVIFFFGGGGASQKVFFPFFLQFSQNIDGFRQSDSQGY